jgi:hypothetical protein
VEHRQFQKLVGPRLKRMNSTDQMWKWLWPKQFMRSALAASPKWFFQQMCSVFQMVRGNTLPTLVSCQTLPLLLRQGERLRSWENCRRKHETE